MRETYRRTGENWLSVQLSRRGMRGLAGRPVDRMRAAGEHVVERLDRLVYSEARTLIESHRARGHLICVASSAWRGVVEPLALRLGADRVIATDYAVEDGRFTGDLLGAWLFGPAKARAVRELAESEGIRLGESYAYTDAWYDRFLLEEVGHPRAVNPDPALRATALFRGWPVLEFRNGATPRPGADLFDLLRPLLHPRLLPMRIEVEGDEHLPREGAFIVAANHRSYLDGLVLAAIGSRRGRKLRFLGKREIFEAPVLGHIAYAAGQIPVDRGSGSLRPLREALDALERGQAVAILPQGTIPRGEAFFEPCLRGRVGVARLALASGAPVIPVALWGTEDIWP
ncbi:MAG: HAD-IB family hydrolase, partial [Actinomycetota bacterium]